MTDPVEDALRAALHGARVPLPEPRLDEAVVARVRRHRRRRTAAGLAAAGAALALAVTVPWTIPPTADSAPPATAEATATATRTVPRPAAAIARWPDGGEALQVPHLTGRNGVWLARGGETLWLPGKAQRPLEAAAVPSGQLVLARDQLGSPLLFLVTTARIEEIPHASGSRVLVSPDGRTYALVTEGSGSGAGRIEVFEVAAGHRRVSTAPLASGARVASGQAWTERGILVMRPAVGGLREALLVDPASGAASRLGALVGGAVPAAGRRTVTLLGVDGGGAGAGYPVTVTTIDVRSGEKVGADSRVTVGATVAGREEMALARLSRDGSRLLLGDTVHFLDQPGVSVRLPFRPGQRPAAGQDGSAAAWGDGTALVLGQARGGGPVDLGECDLATTVLRCTRFTRPGAVSLPVLVD